MPDPSNRRIPWPRIFAEGVVIVASILLAFGIDAWWEERGTGLEVRQELQSVLEELNENRQRLQFNLDMMERIAGAGASMAEILESDQENDLTELPDTLVWMGSMANVTFDASTGALEALITSGRLASVDDPEVRRGLAGLRDRFEDAVETQVRAIELFDTQLGPETWDEIDNRPLNDVSRSFWAAERVPGRALMHGTDLRFPNRPGIRNLVRYRTSLYVNTIPEMRGLLVELEELIGLTEGLI